MDELVKRKPGRPSTGKRGSFTFRLRDGIRAKLIAAARENKISVSEEIERRLEFSFHDEPVLTELRRMILMADAIARHKNGQIVSLAAGEIAAKTHVLSDIRTTLLAHDNARGDEVE
jgi:hypothetical protein